MTVIRGDFDRLQCAELARVCVDLGQPESAVEFILDGVSPDEAHRLIVGENKVRAVARSHPMGDVSLASVMSELEAAAVARFRAQSQPDPTWANEATAKRFASGG